MNTLASLLSSILIIGSFVTPASACMSPEWSGGESTMDVAAQRRTNMVKMTRRTLINRTRSGWNR